MELTFLPPRQRSISWNIAIMVGLVLLSFSLILLANLPGFIDFATPIIAFALGLALPFFYLLYQYLKARQIRYVLDEERLCVQWGVNRLSLPLRGIDWAHQTSEFEDEMPLPRWHLPGAYLNHHHIRGMGKTRFVATDPMRMILIKAGERYVVVSPREPLAFLERLEALKSLAPATDEQAEEENFKSLLGKVWQDKLAKALFIAGSIALVLLWVSVGLMMGLRQTVTWVTLEQVRTSQLLLLAIFGTFIWLDNSVVSFFVLIQERIEKFLGHLLLATTVLACLILSVAALLMAL